MTPGEKLRAEALDRAILHSRETDSADDIIKSAEKFEKYMKSGAGTADD